MLREDRTTLYTITLSPESLAECNMCAEERKDVS